MKNIKYPAIYFIISQITFLILSSFCTWDLTWFLQIPEFSNDARAGIAIIWILITSAAIAISATIKDIMEN